MSQPKNVSELNIMRQYLVQAGGYIYGEVPIGKIPNRLLWSDKCSIRRIDGVRIPIEFKTEDILHFQTNRMQFMEQICTHTPEIIEAKLKLNRLVIGQVLAAEDLFTVQYQVPKVHLVILCNKTDSAMEWVCQKRNIKVIQFD